MLGGCFSALYPHRRHPTAEVRQGTEIEAKRSARSVNCIVNASILHAQALTIPLQPLPRFCARDLDPIK